MLSHAITDRREGVREDQGAIAIFVPTAVRLEIATTGNVNQIALHHRSDGVESLLQRPSVATAAFLESRENVCALSSLSRQPQFFNAVRTLLLPLSSAITPARPLHGRVDATQHFRRHRAGTSSGSLGQISVRELLSPHVPPAIRARR